MEVASRARIHRALARITGAREVRMKPGAWSEWLRAKEAKERKADAKAKAGTEPSRNAERRPAEVGTRAAAE